MKSLIEILRLVSISSFVIAAIFAATYYKKFNRYPARAMAWFIFFGAFFELESFITGYLVINNITHFYIYFLLELILVPYLMSGFTFMKPYRRTILAIMCSLWLVSLVEIGFVWPDKVNTYTRILECAFFVWLGVFTTNRINATPRAAIRLQMEEFWMSQAIIIYFLIHPIVIVVTNYSIQHFGLDFGRKIWMFNSIAAIFSNSFLIWGIWKIYLLKPSSRG